jgi:mannose-1-phosphate guanylyltransferase
MTRYAVILAGGAGKRLWPWSRLSRPKQLLPLLGGKTLMHLAVERLEGLFSPKNILIITNADYTDSVRGALPGIVPQNVVGEPVGRDTANAVALAAELIDAREPKATMAVFTADQVIRPIEQFQASVRAAIRAAEEHPDALLTFGIRPTWPNTGLGYIHSGSELGNGARPVQGFKEKPNHQLARQYVDSGEYFWNSGMFVWKAKTIREALAEFLPASFDALRGIGKASREDKDIAPLLAAAYPSLQRISIDFAVMERARKVFMVELACEWFDVGSWPALEEVGESDDADNTVVAGKVVLVDSYRNVVATEDGHLLAVLGIDDCVIVHSSDATLVCAKSDSQRLKELVELIEKQHGPKYV